MFSLTAHVDLRERLVKRISILLGICLCGSAVAQEREELSWGQLFQGSDPGPMIGLRLEQLHPAICPSGWVLISQADGDASYKCYDYNVSSLQAVVQTESGLITSAVSAIGFYGAHGGDTSQGDIYLTLFQEVLAQVGCRTVSGSQTENGNTQRWGWVCNNRTYDLAHTHNYAEDSCVILFTTWMSRQQD